MDSFSLAGRRTGVDKPTRESVDGAAFRRACSKGQECGMAPIIVPPCESVAPAAANERMRNRGRVPEKLGVQIILCLLYPLRLPSLLISWGKKGSFRANIWDWHGLGVSFPLCGQSALHS